MTIYQVDVALVASLNVGAHIWPPDGKMPTDEGAEVFGFAPCIDGARALTAAEVSLLQRSRVELMQKRQKPLHCAGIHTNLIIASQSLASLIEKLSPKKHQMIPLKNVWFQKDPQVVPDQYVAILIMDYAHTLDLERAKIRRKFIAHLGKDFVRLVSLYPKDRVILPASTVGRHIWADATTGAIFCSEEFRDAALSLPGPTGLDFGACVEN